MGRLDQKDTIALVDRVGTWRYSTDNRQHGFFLAKRVRNYEKPSARSLRAQIGEDDEEDPGYRWAVGSLGDFERGFFQGIDEDDQFVAFVDSSTFAEHPSWPLRNLLVLIRQRYHLKKVQILCYRDTQARRDESKSIILPLTMDDVDEIETADMPRVTGWERDVNQKLYFRAVNLGEYMDPHRLADQAVDLNLKLMKWRISPNLDLDSVKEVSCLLLGAGTLGSYVSRNLMGWGVRRITLVDYGSVSFSNPVRQPLFEYNDCLKGGAPKAQRAAEALERIYPGVTATGHHLSVPMLGHAMTDESKTKADYEALEALIESHDVIFLLMDTRESRWLPTVIGKAKGKIVMNAALGFDTYVVMRHGARPKEDGEEATLGCYFCNDVVAPADVSWLASRKKYELTSSQSMKDQTLDQQCTVTRPGVAAIASALLVELLISILQHPQRHHAPAPVPNADSTFDRDPEDHALGIVPHQVRGFLANFQNLVIHGQSYPSCSACSAPILDAYEKEGWDFVKKALADRDYVAELSGLAEIQRQAEAMAAELDLSDDGDDDGEAVLL